MQPKSWKALVPLMIAGAGLGAPAPVVAQSTLDPGTWTGFDWFDGTGSTVEWSGGSIFLLSASTAARIRITDGYDSGDVFALYVDGVLFGTTSSVVPGVPTDASDGASAWAEPELSKGAFLVSPGSHELKVRVEQDGGWGYGTGFIRADLAPASAAPEPAGTLLLASGLSGVWAVRRRRRRGPSRPARSA